MTGNLLHVKPLFSKRSPFFQKRRFLFSYVWPVCMRESAILNSWGIVCTYIPTFRLYELKAEMSFI